MGRSPVSRRPSTRSTTIACAPFSISPRVLTTSAPGRSATWISRRRGPRPRRTTRCSARPSAASCPGAARLSSKRPAHAFGRRRRPLISPDQLGRSAKTSRTSAVSPQASGRRRTWTLGCLTGSPAPSSKGACTLSCRSPTVSKRARQGDLLGSKTRVQSTASKAVNGLRALRKCGQRRPRSKLGA